MKGCVNRVDKDEYNVKIGQAVARQRKKAGLTQSQVAEFLKVKKGTVSRIERGANAIDIGKLYRLHELFKCEAGDFFWTENDDAIKYVVDAMAILNTLPEDKRTAVLNIFEIAARDVNSLNASGEETFE